MLFNLMDVAFPVIFVVIFSVVAVFFAVILIRSIREWNNNNHSPRLTVEAKVVAKRSTVSHHHGSDHMMTTTTTTYYVTFQVESGDRMEFTMPGHQYGYMVEGDIGRLTFQGTRFLSFDRM